MSAWAGRGAQSGVRASGAPERPLQVDPALSRGRAPGALPAPGTCGRARGGAAPPPPGGSPGPSRAGGGARGGAGLRGLPAPETPRSAPRRPRPGERSGDPRSPGPEVKLRARWSRGLRQRVAGKKWGLEKRQELHTGGSWGRGAGRVYKGGGFRAGAGTRGRGEEERSTLESLRAKAGQGVGGVYTEGAEAGAGQRGRRRLSRSGAGPARTVATGLRRGVGATEIGGGT